MLLTGEKSLSKENLGHEQISFLLYGPGCLFNVEKKKEVFLLNKLFIFNEHHLCTQDPLEAIVVSRVRDPNPLANKTHRDL